MGFCRKIWLCHFFHIWNPNPGTKKIQKSSTFHKNNFKFWESIISDKSKILIESSLFSSQNYKKLAENEVFGPKKSNFERKKMPKKIYSLKLHFLYFLAKFQQKMKKNLQKRSNFWGSKKYQKCEKIHFLKLHFLHFLAKFKQKIAKNYKNMAKNCIFDLKSKFFFGGGGKKCQKLYFR